MANSSIKTIKGLDGEDTIVFTRPKTKPDVSMPPNSLLRDDWHFWLCEGYGDSPFVYCSYGNHYAKVIQLSSNGDQVNVLLLSSSGSIDRVTTVPRDNSVIHKEAAKLITDEIIRRTLLV